MAERVAAVERLEDVVVVAEDVGQLEHAHLRNERRQRRGGDRPEIDGAELDLLGHLALAAERAGMVVGDLDLAAGQLGELVGELLGGLRGAVLGRIDVAHAQVLVLSPHRAPDGQHGPENGKPRAREPQRTN